MARLFLLVAALASSQRGAYTSIQALEQSHPPSSPLSSSQPSPHGHPSEPYSQPESSLLSDAASRRPPPRAPSPLRLALLETRASYYRKVGSSIVDTDADAADAADAAKEEAARDSAAAAASSAQASAQAAAHARRTAPQLRRKGGLFDGKFAEYAALEAASTFSFRAGSMTRATLERLAQLRRKVGEDARLKERGGRWSSIAKNRFKRVSLGLEASLSRVESRSQRARKGEAPDTNTVNGAWDFVFEVWWLRCCCFPIPPNPWLTVDQTPTWALRGSRIPVVQGRV